MQHSFESCPEDFHSEAQSTLSDSILGIDRGIFEDALSLACACQAPTSTAA
jgi:hypothetical protein